MSNILSTILATKEQEVALGKKTHSTQQLAALVDTLPKCRGFYQAIKHHDDNQKISIIAEVKKASPSKGVICENFEPGKIAQQYEQGNATCLSVLTDVDYFKGHNDYLMVAKNAVTIPVLRKDFIIDKWQVYQSRLLGADCILLIVAALADPLLYELTVLAQKLGMDVLMEVHDHDELKRALNTPAKLIGINNRNLKTFVTSLDTSINLSQLIPSDRIVISESGINGSSDIRKLQEHNINCFLIGESFMRAQNPGKQLSQMLMEC